MSESLDGVSFSVTRQNAGSVLNAAAAFALVAFGGVKAPSATDSADSMRPFVTCVCASDSHAIGDGAAAFSVPSVTAPSRAIPAAVFMPGSLDHGEGLGLEHTARVGSRIGIECPREVIMNRIVPIVLVTLAASIGMFAQGR